MIFNFGSLSWNISNYLDLLWALLYPEEAQNAIKSFPTVTSQQSNNNETVQETVNSVAPAGVVSSYPGRRSTLFALIIGIDKYAGTTPLKGAVADAESIEGYLVNDLGIPSTDIIKLVNQQATRARIIEEFQRLSKNPHIRSGDPILIFYAGHGGETKAPARWTAEGDKIQCILPVDYNCELGGEKVKGIPDRTIGMLLDQLAKAKGDNITVVFDCCHSGSATRTDAVDPTRLVRGVDISIPFSDTDDLAILSSPSKHRAQAIAPGFLRKGLRSHVLLAACGREELAREEDMKGVFTQALLETLRSSGANQLTYTELIMRLPKLASQNPQCEGYHKDRILFNNRGPSRQIYYKVRKSDDKLEYQMNAGSAHGITEEAKFALYRDRDSFSGPPSAVLIAQTPMAFSTTLISAGDNDSSVSIKEGFVRQTHAGVGEDLRLYVIMDERLLKVFESLSKEMDRNDDRKRRIKLVERKEDAELAIDIDSQEDVVVFDMRDLCGRTYRVPKTVKLLVDEFLADDVYAVINAAVHYYYHLRRSPVKEMFGKKVDIEFLKLKKTDEFDYETFSFAVVPDPDGGNLNVAGNVDVFVDDDAMYGMRITSRLPPKAPELYCSVFFFDSDFSIVSYYEPGIAGGHVDASLKPNSKGAVTIGFGAGGVPARGYHLETGNDSDVGFLKVFLSTEPLDLSHICQRSPFDGLRKEKSVEPQRPPLWDTVIITINQMRGRTPTTST